MCCDVRFATLSGPPVLTFSGPLFTGAVRSDDGSAPVYARYDDDLVSASASASAAQEIVIDHCVLLVARKLQLTTAYGATGAAARAAGINSNYIFIRLMRGAHINITSNATLEVG